MLGDLKGDVLARVLQTFPERQIYLRSGGEVSYFNLTTKLQVIIVSTIAFMALWCLLTVINLVFNLHLLGSGDHTVREYEARYQRLLASSEAKEESAKRMLAEQQASFERIAANMEAKHEALSQIVGLDSIDLADTHSQTVHFANSDVVVSPVARDTVSRVALRSSIGDAVAAPGLPVASAMNALGSDQNAILLSAEAELLDDIAFNRSIIRATDMNVETVLEQGAQGQGGPYIPADGSLLPASESDFHPRVTAIQARLYEAKALDTVVEALPLGHPVEYETVMTSAFGVRSDPFTKRPTIHYGLDFIGGSMAPIVATAPGVVTYSGRKGAFGRVVEIDHGHGFTTRYAHLRKSYVKVGQTVEKGERIGGMGSTGRSTGTHLHYEVRFQDRAYDPEKFLKAGLHVQ